MIASRGGSGRRGGAPRLVASSTQNLKLDGEAGRPGTRTTHYATHSTRPSGRTALTRAIVSILGKGQVRPGEAPLSRFRTAWRTQESLSNQRFLNIREGSGVGAESRSNSAYRLERAAVQRTGPETRQGGGVFAGRIACMARETVAGMNRVEPRHQRVARDFGDDRSGGDRQRQSVAADDRRAPDRAGPAACRGRRSARSRALTESAATARAHRQQRRAADVEAVDLFDAGEGERRPRSPWRRSPPPEPRAAPRSTPSNRRGPRAGRRDRESPRRRRPARRAVRGRLRRRPRPIAAPRRSTRARCRNSARPSAVSRAGRGRVARDRRR